MKLKILSKQNSKNSRDEDSKLFDISPPSTVYVVSKRILDIVGAIVGLIVFSPVMAAVVLMVKICDSPGSVIFRAERVGQDGKIFNMYKFRTMYQDYPEQSRAPADLKDKRATKVGRWLRRTSLDELPQFWNILKGDMSLVGPRPEQTFIVEKYEPWQRKKLAVPQGLTGLWQISGRMDIPGDEMIRRDLIYVRMRSFLIDILILLKTIPAVINGKGAY